MAWLVLVPCTAVLDDQLISHRRAATTSCASDDGHNAPRHLAEVDAFACAVVA